MARPLKVPRLTMINHPRPPGSRRRERQQNDENRLSGIYGDHIKPKRKNMVRILFQNPQGIGRLDLNGQMHTDKLNAIKTFTLKHAVDVVGFAEVNKDWRNIPQSQTLWEATSGWFEYQRLITGINQRINSSSQIQFGGTLLLTINETAHRIVATDKDPRLLGRWTSVLLNGKNGKKCRMVCAYCPCISTGPTSVYAQQTAGLAQQNIHECPRKVFWDDLKTYIQQRQEQGEVIILLGDWNSEYTDLTRWMNNLGYKDAIQSRHVGQEPPITCKRSNSQPIDAIFIPQSFNCHRGGFLAFGSLKGDHRGLWCDIPMDDIIGFNLQKLPNPQARRLKVIDPRTRKKYLKTLHTLLVKNNLYERQQRLFNSITAHKDSLDVQEFEEIDKHITTAMEMAERGCRKLKLGNIKWSPTYQKACDEVVYWKIVIAELEGNRINIRKLRTLREKLGYTRFEGTLIFARNALSNAITQRTKCKKKAESLQLEYRSRLAIAKEEEDNIKAAIHIQNLTKQEATRQLFRRIRFIEQRTNNLATTKIVIKRKNGQQRELFQQKAMEDAIMFENERKFHQTEGHGQLQTRKILRDIGILGMGKEHKKIFNGTYMPPPGTNKATRSFLKKMEILPREKNSRVHLVSFEEFCIGWKKAKEKTSSTGPHVGHYKTGIQHPGIAKLLYQRSQIPMRTGYVPLRHRQGTDVMLLKKEQVYEVDKLRTIVLFDTEANMNNKHTGRRAMKTAIQNNLIEDEQYSRPGRKSIDHSINRRLVMDHQLYIRQPYVLTRCDLKSCYDRINHTAAGLSLQKVGTPQTEVKALLRTIQLMNHKVRTAFGDSAHTYGGHRMDSRWKLPPQGVLQGNGAGPTIWTIISSMLFSILKTQNFRNSFISSIKKVILELTGFAYVDDTDLIQVGNNMESAVNRMQNLILAWISLVEVTGGLLAPDKCWTYMVDFQLKKGKWTTTTQQPNFSLNIPVKPRRRHTIRQIPTSTGTNMLGVIMSPNGNNLDQITAMRRKAQTWASNISSMGHNVEEVWTALHRTIPFSLGYPLPSLTLTRRDCIYIMAPIHKEGLPRAGIPSTIPTEIRNGLINKGGLGILDLFYHQGTTRIASTVSNIWANNPTGKLMRIALEDIVMEMGLQQISAEWLGLGLLYTTTNSWIKHVLTFMHDHHISIDRFPSPLSPPREGDITIMQKALDFTRDKPTLRAINRVRMELQILWLSDICNAEGGEIDTRWLNRPNGGLPPRNNYQWPLQHKTSIIDWAHWRKFIRHLTLQQYHLHQWRCNDHEWVHHWDALVSATEELLFIRIPGENTWERHIRIDDRGRRTPRYYPEFLLLHHTLPTQHLKRATIRKTGNYIEVISTSNMHREFRRQHTDITTPLPNSKEAIRHRVQLILEPESLEMTEHIDVLLQDFMEGTVIAISDGSYFPHDNTAAGAWIVESRCRTQWIMGSMTCTGPRENFNSFRSELVGLLGASVTLQTLAACVRPPPRVIIGCDGDAALDTLTLPIEKINTNLKHWDLISCIHDIWRSTNMKPLVARVKGHQDEEGRSLSRLEQMNITMDRLAKNTARLLPPRQQTWQVQDLGIPPVYINGTQIVDPLHKSLYKTLTTRDLMGYLERTVGINPADIHWPAFEKARHTTTTVTNTFISKWLSNTVPTGKILQRRQHSISSRCPRCNHWGEDRIHILACWDTGATAIWDKGVESMTRLLETEDTCPEIQQFILDGLRAFRRTPNRVCMEHLTPSWREDVIRVGWHNMLIGILPNSLIQRQQAFYNAIRSRKNATRWAMLLILQSWTLIRNMWLGRCAALHRKHIINSMIGSHLLDLEIEKEYDAGFHNLPVGIHKWFRPSKEKNLEQTIHYKKGWLLIIKSVKESLDIADLGIFTSSKTLRKWIGFKN